MVIEAAKQAGVLIPHYCYHPGLPVAGVCRMCLVEVEGAPKLQIGCATEAQEGMNVKVFSGEAPKARESVLEFLLINHPLDCPICDQAGECELQDYTFQEGRKEGTRYKDFPKRYNPVEDFGGDVLYVTNRCILCTRCVRFMDHVADEPVLNVSERGDRAFIGVHEDQSLEHMWAGNVVDLCPVGSLISKDFLHKARAWELDKTPSICTSCSQGCNVNVDTRGNTVVRLRPRQNDGVNRYFMCDYGRRKYRWMNRGDRIEAPLMKDGDALHATDWDHALERGSDMVKAAGGDIAVIASPSASSEAMYLARKLAGSKFKGVFNVERSNDPETALEGVANLALRQERAANVKAATELGYSEQDDVVGACREASLTIVVLDGLKDVEESNLPANSIFIGSTLLEGAKSATLVLPAANTAEEDGTFVNRDGRVQRYFQARSGPGMTRPAWWILSEILSEATGSEPMDSASAVFDELAAEVSAFGGLSYSSLGTRGAPLSSASPAGVA